MTILTNKTDGILTLTFYRPDKKNAITTSMYQALADTLRAAENDPTVRVILFTGSDDVFTAGNDIEDFIKNAKQLTSISGATSSVAQFMTALSSAPKPVIAAVAGAAVGIGATLLLHCDLVYLADNATLSMPFTQLGLCPEFASSLLLPRVIGYPKAAEKLLLGEPFTAHEAVEIGLANKVVPTKELPGYAHRQANELVALPPASLRATKRLMKFSQTELINQIMQEEMRQFGMMLNAPEAKEAFIAFFQKRKPDFGQFS